MRKLLEIKNNEDIKKSQFLVYALAVLIFSIFILVRTKELSFFEIDFFVEGIFLFTVLRFYGHAHRNKNYAFWGLTAVLVIYLVMHILEYTFIEYNIFVLYFCFMALIFLFINSYIMSSPLYYPRVQWWEYDFRYAGELKATAKVGEEEFEVRVADLRRSIASVLAFEVVPLGEQMSLEISYGKRVFKICGKITTQREVIHGRPLRYGLILNEQTENDKLEVLELTKIWRLHKKANLRRKFAAQKEANAVS